MATATRDKEAQKEERRRAILEHALSVFGEKGYHAAKVEDIVSRAGIARGTFYLYFEDKRATFAELLDTFVARLRDAILRIDPERPVRPQIRDNVERALEILTAERGLARILLSHAHGVDPEFDRKTLDFFDAVADMLERALALGQRMGVVRPCDTRLASYALLGLVKEVCWRVTVAGYDVDRGRFADQLLDQALYGLLPDEMRGAPRETSLEGRGHASGGGGGNGGGCGAGALGGNGASLGGGAL